MKGWGLSLNLLLFRVCYIKLVYSFYGLIIVCLIISLLSARPVRARPAAGDRTVLLKLEASTTPSKVNRCYYNLGEVTYRSGLLLSNQPKHIKTYHAPIKYSKRLNQPYYSVWNFLFIMHTCNQKRYFFSRNFKSRNRIGPHNLDVISLIVGSLLSNSYLEKREYGVRIIFIKYSSNVEYLMWFHSWLASQGYCSNKKPKLSKLIGKGNKVLFIYSFKSYSFSSFIWLFNIFYKDDIKIIPRNLDKYFTPLALATLFLSSIGLGNKAKLEKKSKLATTLVSVEDLKYLSLILKNKYNIDTIIRFDNNNGCGSGAPRASSRRRPDLYIKKYSVSTFSKIVKPHILHSQHHLLNMPILKFNLPSTHGLSTKKDLT